MQFPYLYDTSRARDINSVFAGYNHRHSCLEGQFYDMKNMSSQFFPSLAPRPQRGIITKLTKPQGILDKEDLWWVDDSKLYRNGKEVPLPNVRLSSFAPKTMAKMGADIVIFPDEIYYNTESGECGYLGNVTDSSFTGVVASFAIADERGEAITYHSSEYYESNEAKDGDYQLTVSDNKPSLKRYSAATKMWMTVASTYITISFAGIDKGFSKDDGVTIYSNTNKGLENVFVNSETPGIWSVDTYIVSIKDGSITIPGICTGEVESAIIRVERKIPRMSFVTECGNRMWGCSDDGRELYCSKLGDCKNWRVYKGISTDSWAATVGSDGVFTGAITFEDSPMFFKSNAVYQIMISSSGAHAVRHTDNKGVQIGSDRSLCIINKSLFYKNEMGVCVYRSGVSEIISDDLGAEKYSKAVAGAVGDKYYVSMCDTKGKWSLFVFDAKNKMWIKEDETEAVFFCHHDNELYFVDAKDKMLVSVGGTNEIGIPDTHLEEKVKWYAETGNIGYSSPDYKYLSRISIRLSLDVGSTVDVYVRYDSSEELEYKFSIGGSGTRSVSIPIIPKRCDHFSIRISGTGKCIVHSITKTVEEGGEG